MKNWSEFYDYVLPLAPGAGNALVDVSLRESAIKFYEDSQAWRYTHPQITVTSLTANYPFVPPGSGETEVHVINYAEFNDSEIGTETSNFKARYNNWRDLKSQPEFVVADQTDAILVPTPNLDGTLDMEVSLKPTPASTGIFDDAQYNDYRLFIAYGALYRILRIPKKPYTNQELAQDMLADFNAGVTHASIRVELKYSNAPLETGLHTYRRTETRRRTTRDF